MIYETTAKAIEAEMPRNLRNKSAQEIVDYLVKNFKTDFVDDPGNFREVPKNKATAYMMAVSRAIFNPDDWKSPVKAWFPTCGDEWAKAAIIWYHGANPISNGYWVYSPGYSC